MHKLPIHIAVVDDHTLFRKGLVNLIHSLGEEYKVVIEAANGDELINKLEVNGPVHIAMVDVNMPKKNGFETVVYLKDNYPDIKVMIISMIDREETVVQMLKLGVKAYLSKDVEPFDLKNAINAILEKGYYYTDFITGRLVHELQKANGKPEPSESLSQKELEFLRWACSELTYKEIAGKMGLSVKTIDGIRDNLFRKFETASRVGLVIYAIKKRLVNL